jgi:hypothetical protein
MIHQASPKLRKRSGKNGGFRVSWCPKLQSWFLGLGILWAIYVIGMITMAVNVHKMDPSKSTIDSHANADTNADGNLDTSTSKSQRLSFSSEKVVSPHQLVHVAPPKTTLDPPELLKESKISQMTMQEEAEQKALEAARQVVKEGGKQISGKRAGYKPQPYGHLVNPEAIGAPPENSQAYIPQVRDRVLKAYLEPMEHRKLWDTKPLPLRTTTKEDLIAIPYPKLTSCKRLPEQWPVDEYPDADPFLPWIHDVFPTDDGKYIQFVAQNRLRCNTGTSETEEAFLELRKPYVSLFQHAPLKRLPPRTADGDDYEKRYRLSSHEDADPESMATRFICRFQPSGDETFSVFNNDYEWTSFRKNQRRMFAEDGRDNKQIHTSQLMFKCPVPPHLIEIVRKGTSVQDDWATLFVDLIAVRTPPRHGNPSQFLIPRYADSVPHDYKPSDPFVADQEWGKDHILPRLEDSGRWENIPICQPSLMTYEPQVLEKTPSEIDKGDDGHGINHHLVSCLWASTGYTTRGNRFAINDGQRRLLEWLTFNKLLGFEHFYIYDNSGAFDSGTTLQPIADMFPGQVTVIPWPSKVCNNNPNNVDSVGERSSQYAAETSCRLRFGE